MQFADQTLSDLAITIPMATATFRKNRLDFCCGGKQTLREACAYRGINLEILEEELRELKNMKQTRIDDRPLTEITEFIVKRYHEDLKKRLPELIQLAEKVERVHFDHYQCPRGLVAVLKEMHSEILMHMMKEENVLFPLIEQGRGSLAMMPVKVMHSEHEHHGSQLEEIHRLTSDFTPPEGACGTWRALYFGLEKLEEELMEHIHLENNILFPRALAQKGA